MSRFADIENILLNMLQKYNDNNHLAIVEAYMETLEDGWYDESLHYFLRQELGIIRNS